MRQTVQKIFAPGKGVLALDWSPGTISKQFEKNGLTSTPELNKVYRQMLLSTPGIEKFVSGVILHNETVHQRTDEGKSFPDFLLQKDIMPGVRADQGYEGFESTDQKITKGLEELDERLEKYSSQGLKFTKWRSGFIISDIYPSESFLEESIKRLVEFAKVSHKYNLVPFVEPEVEMKGNHTTTRCSEITTKVLKLLFNELKKYSVDLGSVILKTNMVLPGVDSGVSAESLEVANATLHSFRDSVPPDVGGIVFLSGGQSYDNVVAHLDKIEDLSKNDPWKISFSFARALQKDALATWSGKEENVNEAQKVLLARLEKVSRARKGEL